MNIKKTNIYYETIICMYVFCTVVMDDGAMPMKIARLLLAGTWGLKILSEKRIYLTSYVLRMIPFLLFSALTIVWAESPSFALAMTKTLLINLICMCALISLIDYKRERVDIALKTIIFAPLFLEMRVIWLGGILAYMDDRNVGPISGNTVGICAAFAACFALYYWIQGKNKYSYLFVLNTIILFLSASKTGLL